MGLSSTDEDIALVIRTVVSQGLVVVSVDRSSGTVTVRAPEVQRVPARPRP